MSRTALRRALLGYIYSLLAGAAFVVGLYPVRETDTVPGLWARGVGLSEVLLCVAGSAVLASAIALSEELSHARRVAVLALTGFLLPSALGVWQCWLGGVLEDGIPGGLHALQEVPLFGVQLMSAFGLVLALDLVGLDALRRRDLKSPLIAFLLTATSAMTYGLGLRLWLGPPTPPPMTMGWFGPAPTAFPFSEVRAFDAFVAGLQLTCGLWAADHGAPTLPRERPVEVVT